MANSALSLGNRDQEISCGERAAMFLTIAPPRAAKTESDPVIKI
jgi:hypothetical protein